MAATDPTVRDGVILAAILGVWHWSWKLFGLPCLYPKIKAWLKKRGADPDQVPPSDKE